MVKLKRDINQDKFKSPTSIVSNQNDLHSHEVVGRVSETQLQVGKNYN